MSKRDDAVLQALITAAADGIIVIDGSGHIRMFNPACARLFGYKPEEVIGQSMAMLIPSSDHHLLQHNGRETLGRRKDGSTFPLYLSLGQGRLEGADISVGIVHAISEAGMAPLLDAAHFSAMGQVGSVLAHELNQPLAATMNYVKAAQRTLEPSDGPRAVKARDLLGKAGEQTARVSTIIRNLRDFIGRREISRHSENLNKIIEEAVALGLVGAAGSNLKVEVELDPALPSALVDKVQIQQAIINLIRNAVEAMAEAPIRQLNVQSGLAEGNLAHVSVSDTGAGFSEEVAARLFQPFVTTKEGGMGLGLTISKSIINAHGGRLWATPHEGAGVSFHFHLPLTEKTED